MNKMRENFILQRSLSNTSANNNAAKALRWKQDELAISHNKWNAMKKGCYATDQVIPIPIVVAC